MMKIAFLSLAVLLILVEFSTETSIKLNTVAAQTGTFICCETYAPTQKLFYCVIYNAPNFQMFDVSGVARQFTPATGLGVVEQRVAAVQPQATSPFPIGDWTLGDIFVGHSAGAVVKISGGSNITNPWIVLPGETDSARQTVFDRTGTVYGGDLIVSFTNSVWRVAANGTASLIVRSSSLLNYEGLDIVPVDDARYGPLSGAVVIPQNSAPNNPYSICCDTPTNVAAIDRQGRISFYNTGCYTDQIFVVHTYDNFYGLDYGTGKILSSSWADLQANGLEGEIILMCERWGYPGFSGLRRLYYDKVSQTVKNEPIYLTADSAPTASIWEHGCFSRGGSANVLPGGFSFCFYTDLNPTKMLGAIPTTKSVLENWAITGTESSITYPANAVPPPTNNAVSISILRDGQNGFYLQIVAATASSSASLNLDVVYHGPDDSNLLPRIQNNHNDYYFWDGHNGNFQWTWTSAGTRGVVLGPIGAIIGLNQFDFSFKVNSLAGLNLLILYGNSTDSSQKITGNLVAGETFFLKRISCKCGNGQVGDDPLLKDCDYNAPNATCCTRDCHFQPATQLCASPAAGDQCSAPSYCTGKSATCPPMVLVSACNCTAPYYGYGCHNIRCDQFTTCSSCNAYPECSYCCNGTSGGGTCVKNETCTNHYPKTCAACPACQAGTCQCGVCVCSPGFAGATCNYTIDCTGAQVPVGQTPKVIDICGVCGGNGTTCIGCDGIPFGKVYDNCGVCGGNGTSCYNPCPGTSCGDCVKADACAWCSVDNTCHPKTYTGCTSEMQKSNSDCNPFPTKIVVAATIGTAAIVGIVIGGAVFAALAFIGGKKGYDAYTRNKNNMTGANTNPFYNDNGRSGTSALYELKPK